MPTYETFGRGCEFLEFQFQILMKQTFKDFEVVISDHSKNEEIKNLCERYSDKLKVVYIHNPLNRGSLSHNTNNAIKNCSGNIIKILFQDDFLYGEDSLQKIYDSFTPDIQWVIGSCEHISDSSNGLFNKVVPRYSDEIMSGVNTIGNPSVVAFRNVEDNVLFDEKMTWTVDLDYYKRMHDKNGNPAVINDTIVIIRIWDKQLTNLIPNKIKQREERLIRDRYAKS